MRIFGNVAGCFIFLLVMPAVMHAQIVQEFKPSMANCCLPSAAQSLADQLQDWDQMGRYHEDNLRLQSLPEDSARIVFLGDSITEQIHAVYADYFSALADANGYLKQGYSGDGLHPNDKGYALMAPIVQAAIDKALK